LFHSFAARLSSSYGVQAPGAARLASSYGVQAPGAARLASWLVLITSMRSRRQISRANGGRRS